MPSSRFLLRYGRESVRESSSIFRHIRRERRDTRSGNERTYACRGRAVRDAAAGRHYRSGLPTGHAVVIGIFGFEREFKQIFG